LPGSCSADCRGPSDRARAPGRVGLADRDFDSGLIAGDRGGVGDLGSAAVITWRSTTAPYLQEPVAATPDRTASAVFSRESVGCSTRRDIPAGHGLGATGRGLGAGESAAALASGVGPVQRALARLIAIQGLALTVRMVAVLLRGPRTRGDDLGDAPRIGALDAQGHVAERDLGAGQRNAT